MNIVHREQISSDPPIVDSTGTISMMWNQSIVDSTDTFYIESDPLVRSRYEDWMCDFMMCSMERPQIYMDM